MLYMDPMEMLVDGYQCFFLPKAVLLGKAEKVFPLNPQSNSQFRLIIVGGGLTC